DKNGAIRRCDSFDLLEHRFKSGTIADHLLESALVRNLITTPEFLESSHREPPDMYALLIGLNFPEPLECPRAGPRHQTVWQETPLPRLSAPAFAFWCRRVP